MFYGETDLKDVLAESAPAIIDTGSSTLGVPGTLHKVLTEKWKDDIGSAGAKLDCLTDDNFCQVADKCDVVASKVKPIGFQLSGTVFEVPPSVYLHQTTDVCQLGIYKNEIGGESSNMFIIGEPLLKSLYIVYDFEKQEIKMGKNKDAKDEIVIYKPGQREEGVAILAQQSESGEEAPVTMEQLEKSSEEAYDTLTSDI